MKRISVLNSDDLQRPALAFPTVALFSVGYTLFVYLTVYGWKGDLPISITFPLQSLLTFVLFTPFHDAAHSSIGRNKFKLLNELIGRLYGLLFMASFPAFRWLHLKHHKVTNQKDDPDAYAAGYKGCPRWMLPFFWMTIDFHYIYSYGRNYRINRDRPLLEFIEAFGITISLHALGQYLIYNYPYKMMLYWVLPRRLGLGFLVYLFDYVPHHPHIISASQDPYKATAQINGILKPEDTPTSVMDVLFLYQNYHNIHHLYPSLPFYKMGKVWWKYREKFVELGAFIHPVFGDCELKSDGGDNHDSDSTAVESPVRNRKIHGINQR